MAIIVVFLIFLALCIIAAFVCCTLILYKSTLHYCPGSSSTEPLHTEQQRVLIINPQPGCGGGEVYTLNLFKVLRDASHTAVILVKKNSWLEQQLRAQQLPYYALRSFKFRLANALAQICKANALTIIHCNTLAEVPAAQKAAKKLNLFTVFSRHNDRTHTPLDMAVFKDIDGIVAVSPLIEQETHDETKGKTKALQQIACITPFFDEQKFLSAQSIHQNPQRYIQDTFGINTHNLPILLCIANIADDKNQTLLLQALHLLMYQRNKKTCTLFAGRGDFSHLLALRKKLALEDYAHFVGYVADTHKLLACASIKVLPSKREGFGIVLLEAALMKKPLIGAAGTGVMSTIKHEQTGLLFTNNDAQSLADALERLLDNPAYAAALGQAAYEHVMHNFSMHSNQQKLTTFYRSLLLQP